MKKFIKHLSEHTMDLILCVLAISTAIFVGIMIWLYVLMGSVPDTLIQCWFQYLLGTECGVMGLIQIAKKIKWNAAEKDKEIDKQKRALSEMKQAEEALKNDNK